MEATQLDVEAMGLDPMSSLSKKSKLLSNKFQTEALRQAIGEARANQILQSISMGVIPIIKSADSLKNAKEGEENKPTKVRS